MTAPTIAALARDQLGHRLVDRAGGEQVPGGDGVALADAVAAVLGLVVHRGRPLELEERDVRGAREREALRGDARRARRSAAGRRRSWNARTVASRAAHRVAPRAGARRPGSARAPPPAPRRGAANTTSGSPLARKSWIHASAACSLPRAASRCSVVSCARRSARSARAIFASSSERSSGCSRSHAITSCSASRYSLLVVERHRHDDLALGRQLRQHLLLEPPHEAACGAGASAAAPRAAAPWNWRAKRAPLPKSSSRPSTRSWVISSSAWLSTGVPVSASRSAVGRQRGGEPPHRLGALGARVLGECDSSSTSALQRAGGRAPRGARATIS